MDHLLHPAKIWPVLLGTARLFVLCISKSTTYCKVTIDSRNSHDGLHLRFGSCCKPDTQTQTHVRGEYPLSFLMVIVPVSILALSCANKTGLRTENVTVPPVRWIRSTSTLHSLAISATTAAVPTYKTGKEKPYYDVILWYNVHLILEIFLTWCQDQQLSSVLIF